MYICRETRCSTWEDALDELFLCWKVVPKWYQSGPKINGNQIKSIKKRSWGLSGDGLGAILATRANKTPKSSFDPPSSPFLGFKIPSRWRPKPSQKRSKVVQKIRDFSIAFYMASRSILGAIL